MSKKYQNDNVLKHSDKEYFDKKETMCSFFLDSNYVPMTLKQICNILQIPNKDIVLLNMIITDLEESGVIFCDDSKRFCVIDGKNFVKGIYHAKNYKFGFCIDGMSKDVYIKREDNLFAMDKDEVVVKITKQEKDGMSKEGKVVKILKRNTKRVIGKFTKSKNFGFVVTLEKKIEDIYIPKKYINNIKDGSFVEVEFLKYQTANSKAEGKIIGIVDTKKIEHPEVIAMYKSYDLDEKEDFPEFVKEEVKNIPDHVLKNELKNRVDRRDQKVFTIDSEDAMDLDDGVFVKKDNDKYILSVYIADVSHYVKDSTFLDKEAIKRGTSIYIPGRVIPMLPKELSNGICSLNAGVDRLALAIDITYDKSGNVLDYDIFKAVINVNKKMSYNKVFKVLNNEDKVVLNEYKDYIDDIKVMAELASILNKKRIRDGSITFDVKETKVIVDENFNVTDVKAYEKNFANDIIEEFMLAANMTIAKNFYFIGLPFIYRIHEKPDEERIRELNEFLANYKIRIKAVKNVQPKTLSSILDEFKDNENKDVLSSVMLRTLKLAKYSDECLGHFGLAAKYYCHFTSPIRRYPDLFIHRVISDYIEYNSQIPEKLLTKYENDAKIYSVSSSEAEKQATTIERDFDSLYETIYMQQFIGQDFDGIVSSVTSFGMFVKLDNTVEGLVPFNNILIDDFFEYDENLKILIGRKTGRTFKIGDKVKVTLVRADSFAKEIDFEIRGENGNERKREEKSRKKGRKEK